MSSGTCLLSSATVDTSIGRIKLSACPQGLHLIELTITKECELETGCDDGRVLVLEFPRQENLESQDHIHKGIKWLTKYFSGNMECTHEVPTLCFSNLPDFTTRVYKQLLQTRPGDTLTYSELSQRTIGSSKAARAVGNAMKRNPFILVVPCHRVVPSLTRHNKSCNPFGKYACGSSLKERLINFERNAFTS